MITRAGFTLGPGAPNFLSDSRQTFLAFFVKFYRLELYKQSGTAKVIMLLRDHPLLSCYGIPSWPPTWVLLLGRGPTRLKGEIGILTGILPADFSSTYRCFLYMEHEESSYLGCLLFHDITFARHITTLLQCYCNRPIAEIGSLDLTCTL